MSQPNTLGMVVDLCLAYCLAFSCRRLQRPTRLQPCPNPRLERGDRDRHAALLAAGHPLAAAGGDACGARWLRWLARRRSVAGATHHPEGPRSGPCRRNGARLAWRLPRITAAAPWRQRRPAPDPADGHPAAGRDPGRCRSRRQRQPALAAPGTRPPLQPRPLADRWTAGRRRDGLPRRPEPRSRQPLRATWRAMPVFHMRGEHQLDPAATTWLSCRSRPRMWRSTICCSIWP